MTSQQWSETRVLQYVQRPLQLRLVYTYDASTSISTCISHVWTGTTQAPLAQAQEKGTRSFFLCLPRPGSHVVYACACACVVRVNQPLAITGTQSCSARQHYNHGQNLLNKKPHVVQKCCALAPADETPAGQSNRVQRLSFWGHH